MTSCSRAPAIFRAIAAWASLSPRGIALPQILAELGHVAEGVAAARAVRRLATHHALDMPIVDAVHRVLYEELSPRDAVLELLRREPRAETE